MKHTKRFNVLDRVYPVLCDSIGTSIALRAKELYQSGQHKLLASMTVDPENYISAENFVQDYTVVNLVKKFKGLKTGVNTKEEALLAFKSAEVQCSDTNRRFRYIRESQFDFAEQFHTARRKIAKLLGPFDLKKVDRCGWGPGATDDLRRSQAYPDTKLLKLPISCTHAALPFLKRALHGDLQWSCVILDILPEDLMGPFSFTPGVFHITPGGVLDTVLKHAMADRTILKGARGNGFLQKGAGSYLRSRLKSVGIDLDNQGNNQMGAFKALTERLATLDLKAASDTVALELVYELLPVDWAIYLDAIREKNYRLPKSRTWHKLEKFSSMGNGFTFELETLIFWALSESVRSQTDPASLVYGDDIIVSKSAAKALIPLLEVAGFTINSSKSYVSGPFYESCGRHYFDGIDVTPIYQKEIPYADTHESVRFANRLIRLALRLASRHCCYKWLEAAWRCAWLTRGKETGIYQLPLGTEGDDGWLVPAHLFSRVASDSSLGLHCNVIRDVTMSLPGHDGALYALALRQGSNPARKDRLLFPEPKGDPTLGLVESRDNNDTVRVPGRRWVCPTGEFVLI